MTDFHKFLNEQPHDSEIRDEYDALEPEFSVMQVLIDARKRTGMTQRQLSECTGIAQGDISKMECGNANLSVNTLRRLAAGLGLRVKIEFLPLQ